MTWIRENIRLLIVGVVLVVAGYAAGRWSAPTKVIERSSDTSWMDVKSARTRLVDRDEKVQTVRHVVTVIERVPATGEVRTTRTEDSTTGVDLHAHATDTGTTEVHQGEIKTTERIVERERASLAIEATAVVGLRLPVPLDGWQVQAQKRIIGPAWLGLGVGHVSGEWRGLVTARMEF